MEQLIDNSTNGEEPTLQQQLEEMENPVDESSLESNPEASEANGDGELILGKFKSHEDLEKAYTELQQKLSSGGDEKKEGEVDGEPSLEIENQEGLESSDAFAKATQEFEEGGALSDATYEALAEKHGLPKEYVDQYIQGIQAANQLTQTQADAQVSSVIDSIGGQDNFQAMSEWARGNLSEGELRAYNQSVNSNDEGQIKFAVSSLFARFSASEGFSPKVQLQGMTASRGITPFNSRGEIRTAMSDPRYGTDSHYTKMVDSRIGIS